jgi:HPt (histidine-containing phosphotransfer) domain-containing protein
MQITKLQLKQIIKEEIKNTVESAENQAKRLKKQFPNYSEQEIQALAQALEDLPRGSKDPQHSQGVPKLEKKPELRRLGITEQELREIVGLDQFEATEYEMLNAKWKNPQKYGAMSDEERATLESYQSRIQQAQKGPRGGSDMTPEDAQFFTMVAMKHPSERTDEEKQKMSHLRAKYRMDVDSGFSGYPAVDREPYKDVDPLAPTEEIPLGDAPTVKTPRLYKESKKIKLKLKAISRED